MFASPSLFILLHSPPSSSCLLALARYSLDGLALFLSSSFRLSFSLFLVLHKLCMSSMYIIYTDLAPEHRAAANAGSRIAGKVRGLQFSSSRRSAYIIGRSGYSACAIHPAEATGTFAPRYKRAIALARKRDTGGRSAPGGPSEGVSRGGSECDRTSRECIASRGPSPRSQIAQDEEKEKRRRREASHQVPASRVQ